MAGVEGRVALVTGAGSEFGIGFATARLLRAKDLRAAREPGWWSRRDLCEYSGSHRFGDGHELDRGN